MKKLVILLVGIISLLPSYVQAKTCNIIVHSSTSLKMAEGVMLVAQKYKHFDNVTILKNNGNYLVSVADVNKALSERILEEWKEEKIIPKNSFCLTKKYTRVHSKAIKKVTPVTKVKRKQSSTAKGKVCNVIIHTSKSLQTTRKEILKYKHFKNASILKNKKWYFVSVAKINKQQSNKILKQWKAQRKIPQDSFCSTRRYRTVNLKSGNNTVLKASKTAKKPNKEMKVTSKAKLKQVKPQKTMSKKLKNGTQPLNPQKALVLDFNKKIKIYQNNKLKLIDSYNKTNNALKLTLQSPTQDNLSKYKKLLQGLLVTKKVLVESYNNVANDYRKNRDYFNKIKGVDKLPSFLKNEKMNIEMISNKLLEMKGKLCQNKSFNCN
ncbi:hypothetical protein [Phocoenobacter atlanticus]|uniref:hypothetical protein n=1 Tax=Phocoenobacter atlanticus TaxID=3416742 RepID=UPI002745EB43|nr:hypothetical protein [Pasteurella atlantica]MDP8101290.1 hypothetical protein [Pasteurella atlantica]